MYHKLVEYNHMETIYIYMVNMVNMVFVGMLAMQNI